MPPTSVDFSQTNFLASPVVRHFEVAEFSAGSADVHFVLDLRDRWLAEVPCRAVNASRTDVAQDHVRQERGQRVSRVDVDGAHLRPVGTEISQTRLHQVHHEASLDGQAFRRRVPQSDDVFARQESFGEFPRTRDNERGPLMGGTRSREREPIQHRLAGRVDHRNHIRPSHWIHAVDEQPPVLQDGGVLGIEISEALKAERPRRAQ